MLKGSQPWVKGLNRMAEFFALDGLWKTSNTTWKGHMPRTAKKDKPLKNDFFTSDIPLPEKKERKYPDKNLPEGYTRRTFVVSKQYCQWIEDIALHMGKRKMDILAIALREFFSSDRIQELLREIEAKEKSR